MSISLRSQKYGEKYEPKLLYYPKAKTTSEFSAFDLDFPIPSFLFLLFPEVMMKHTQVRASAHQRKSSDSPSFELTREDLLGSGEIGREGFLAFSDNLRDI